MALRRQRTLGKVPLRQKVYKWVQYGNNRKVCSPKHPNAFHSLSDIQPITTPQKVGADLGRKLIPWFRGFTDMYPMYGTKMKPNPIAILRSLRHSMILLHCNCWCVWYSNCCLEAIVECSGVGCIALPDTHGFGQMGIYVHFSSWGTSEIDIPLELELIDHTWRWLHASGITFGSTCHSVIQFQRCRWFSLACLLVLARGAIIRLLGNRCLGDLQFLGVPIPIQPSEANRRDLNIWKIKKKHVQFTGASHTKHNNALIAWPFWFAMERVSQRSAGLVAFRATVT